jgi:N-acetylglucosaminyldiphosphoundecaprenol N-acetyl-beta-D-mannosaminyltransferase
LTALRNRLQLRYPRIELAGTESPPFRALEAWELEEAAARIGAVNTQLLWIGLGTPKQDLVADTLRDLSAAPVILCVGAAFDFLAGAKRRAPKWMQQAGLEWLHRLGSEPGRLGRRYLVGNPRFMWGVAWELLSRRHG